VNQSERSPLKKSPIKSSPVKSPSKSLRHYFKSAMDPKQTLSDPVTADNHQAGTTSIVANKVVWSLDETFSLDLPPVSQLDSNVLEALPTELREKIVASYSKMQTCDRHPLTTSDGPDDKSFPEPEGVAEKPVEAEQFNGAEWGFDGAVEEDQCEEVIVRDESRLLEDWKMDICEWTDSFRDGPSDDDVLIVATHLCKMACTNLKVVEVCLKIFKRFLLIRALSAWTTCYNVLLEQVQEKVFIVYRGTLKIEPLAELGNSHLEEKSRIL